MITNVISVACSAPLRLALDVLDHFFDFQYVVAVFVSLACMRLRCAQHWAYSSRVPLRIASSSASSSEAPACSGGMIPNSAAGLVFSTTAYVLRLSLSIFFTIGISSVIYVLLLVLGTLS